MPRLETNPPKPVSGKYTKYIDSTEKGRLKRERMLKLFPSTEKFSYLFADESDVDGLKEAREQFRRLKPDQTDDKGILGKVDLTYSGLQTRENGGPTPPGQELDENVLADKKAGGPANRFVPNLSSPGANDPTSERINVDPSIGAKLSPLEVSSDADLSSPNLKQPADQNVRVTI